MVLFDKDGRNKKYATLGMLSGLKSKELEEPPSPACSMCGWTMPAVTAE